MKGKAKRIACRALALVMLSLFVCSTALASSTAYVNCDALIIRKSASTSADRLTTASKGSKVTVQSVSGGWAKITYHGYTGYAASKYLSASSASSSSSSDKKFSSKVTVYAATSTAIYKSATSSSTKLGTVSKGTKMYAVASNGRFTKVKSTSGSHYGYAVTSNLTKTKPSSSSRSGGSSSTSKADKVIALAKDKLGCKYVIGGGSGSTFDCSGLTKYCFKQVGVHLAHSAKSQGYSGSKLKKSQLQKGDLVFFDTEPEDSDKCDHVGIYLGGGRFIHASSAAGKVIISSMSSGYYSSVFSWGRRVL